MSGVVSGVCARVCQLSVCLLLVIGLAEAAEIYVYWNQTAKMFEPSNNDHMIVANFGDFVEIICPHYPNNSNVAPENFEYYHIYNVDKASYDNCVTSKTANHTMIFIMDCSRPRQPNKRSIIILPLSPMVNMPDFEMDKDYYFISTSRGRLSEIRNSYHGACTNHNMKMIIQVRKKNIDNPSGGSSDRSTARPTSNSGGAVRTDPPARTDPPVTNYRTTRPTDPPTTPTTTTTPSTTTKQHDKEGNQAKQKDNCNGIPGPCFPDDGTNVINTNTNTGVIEVEGSPNTGTGIHQIPHFLFFSLLLLLRQVVLR